jgi:hypothetical protein
MVIKMAMSEPTWITVHKKGGFAAYALTCTQTIWKDITLVHTIFCSLMLYCFPSSNYAGRVDS